MCIGELCVHVHVYHIHNMDGLLPTYVYMYINLHVHVRVYTCTCTCYDVGVAMHVWSPPTPGKCNVHVYTCMYN